MSWSSAATNSSSEPSRSAALWRRSKPTVDAGLADSARPSHELGQAGHVVRLHVRLEDGDDRNSLSLSERDVVVDQIAVRIDDGELRLRLAAEQVGGACSVVVQELAKEHRT